MMNNKQDRLPPTPKIYFITLSVFRYIDVFTRRNYVELILESLKLYQEEQGLLIYDWIIMTNHLHLIASIGDEDVKGFVRDFKKFTTIQMLDAIKHDPFEVRKEWLLEMLRRNDKVEIFWRGDHHAQAIYYMSYYLVKQNAMYKDPFRAGIVSDARYYQYSSYTARFDNQPGPLELSDVLFVEAIA